VSQATTKKATNNDVMRFTLIGAAIGAVAGIALAFHDSQSLAMFMAYSMDVSMAMAFIGGLIAANCIPVHDE
jgi:hypothetical protein